MSKLTHDEQVAAINKVNPNVEVIGEIINDKTKVLCCCKVCGHKWKAAPRTLKHGHGCPACAGKKLTHADHVAAIKKVNPNVEILGEIINVRTKVLCRCKICGHEWLATPRNLKHGHGCPRCAKIKQANKKRLPHNEQVAAINKVNPNIEILEEIKSAKQKVLCRCPVCGHEWNARPSDLKNRHGCPECAKIKQANAKRKTHAEQIAAIAKVNPNIKVLGEITGADKKVLCRCKICDHEWKAAPRTLKRGHGCPRCAKTNFLTHDIGKLYIMVDDLNVPTMMKIGVSVQEDKRSKEVLISAQKAGVIIPALYVAKTWEGPTELMMRIEQIMHENYAEWNIKFPTKFNGCTEFFYYTPETAGVFDAINDFDYTVVNQF